MRLKSTAVWYDLPGVEAAYMPIGSPSAVDALMNVGRTDATGSHRMAGRYTATSAQFPTWSAAAGWSFLAASSQYIFPGWQLTEKTTMIIRCSSWTYAGSSHLASGMSDGYVESGIFIATTVRFHMNNATFNTGGYTSPDVFALNSSGVYKNGVLIGALSTTPSAFSTVIAIGGRRASGGTVERFSTATIPSFVSYSRILSPAEVWLASRQMAYCEVNPDWNAWARRRRYYYAPSQAAAGRVGIYGRRGAVALPGGVRIGTVNDA